MAHEDRESKVKEEINLSLPIPNVCFAHTGKRFVHDRLWWATQLVYRSRNGLRSSRTGEQRSEQLEIRGHRRGHYLNLISPRSLDGSIVSVGTISNHWQATSKVLANYIRVQHFHGNHHVEVFRQVAGMLRKTVIQSFFEACLDKLR
ncbi:hypothetical protein J6590_030892 [Homalodisca vitripennis]|nr:hypothetical protein J6590_030892 [Homalodisca vitripennis]